MLIGILNYHSVTNNSDKPLSVRIDEFKRQMSYVKDKGLTVTSLEDYMDGKFIDNKTIILTFDDGYKDNYDNVLPILSDLGFTATIYLTINFIESGIIPWHQQPEAAAALNWPQIREMMCHGLRFGSHTLSHPHLTKISEAEARREITESKDYLEQKLGIKVRSLAYPYGSFNETVREMVKQAGYKMAVTQRLGKGEKETRFSLARIEISARDHYHSFKFKLTPIYRLMNEFGFDPLWRMGRRWINKLREPFGS
jgi:peptidoglycan/xylan/chitin deacetylase (PgdA/CDA1 family)